MEKKESQGRKQINSKPKISAEQQRDRKRCQGKPFQKMATPGLERPLEKTKIYETRTGHPHIR